MVTSSFSFQRPLFAASEIAEGMVACQVSHATQLKPVSFTLATNFPMKTRHAILH